MVVVVRVLPKTVQKKPDSRKKKFRKKPSAELPGVIKKKDTYRDNMRGLAMEDPEKLASMIKASLKKKDP